MTLKRDSAAANENTVDKYLHQPINHTFFTRSNVIIETGVFNRALLKLYLPLIRIRKLRRCYDSRCLDYGRMLNDVGSF